ncbi:HAMP domain-containing protein [candidate division KSB1 bacterium]|nr:HAMP domain-containing protein [candidate division KSB1 bacterium]
MKTLRSKFIALLLALTILPGLVIAFFAQNLLEQTLAIGLNDEVQAGLEAALLVVQKQHAQEREALAAELRRAARHIQNNTVAQFERADSADVLWWLDSTRHALHAWPAEMKNAARALALPQFTRRDSLLEAGSDSLVIRLAYQMPNGAWVIGQRTLTEDLRRQTAQVLNAAQYVNLLDLVAGRLRRSLGFTFLVVYAPILLLSLVMGWYFARRITKPLEELAAATRRLVQGDWQYRVALRSHDEIGEMALAFNAMVSDLQRQQEQVIALEKMAAWREIARVLAHEIKNPLTPIQLMVQQMQDEYRGANDDYRAMLKKCGSIIREEISKLQKLVREFSDFARMPELHLAPGQLNELIKEVAALHASRVIKFELDAKLPIFAFDWEALRRVFINLIQNALQSSATAEVTISTKLLVIENRVEIVVADTGSGIAPENLRRIFEPYFSTKKFGMGLGLAIVKRIIEEHNGAIAVTSKVGNGTRFVLSFPT